MEGHVGSIQHEHAGWQHHGVELAVEPGLPSRGLDGAHPHLAYVVLYVLLQECAIFHVCLVI
jgi:hypothetical protein